MEKIKLGDLCTPSQGQLKEKPDTVIDYIDISSVDNETKKVTGYQTMTFSESPSRARKAVKRGSILVSTVRPNLNAVAILENDTPNLSVASTGFCILDCKEDTDERFVFNYCKSKVFIDDMVSQATGASYPAVSDKIVRSALIPAYSYEKQRHIGIILDKVSDVIEKRREELQALDKLIKARFVEMFGDPVLNPFSWEMKRFDEICENLDSRRKPISSGDRVEGIYPYYGASGIVDYVEDYIFDEDILLVSEDGANLLMRSTPIAFSVSGKVWVNNHAHVVRFDKMSLQKYVEIYFSLIDISDSITGSAQPKLNQAKLNAMMIPIPEDTLLDRYCEFLYQVDKSKVIVQKALDEIQTLFDSLMQEYFG